MFVSFVRRGSLQGLRARGQETWQTDQEGVLRAGKSLCALHMTPEDTVLVSSKGTKPSTLVEKWPKFQASKLDSCCSKPVGKGRQASHPSREEKGFPREGEEREPL